MPDTVKLAFFAGFCVGLIASVLQATVETLPF